MSLIGANILGEVRPNFPVVPFQRIRGAGLAVNDPAGRVQEIPTRLPELRPRAVPSEMIQTSLNSTTSRISARAATSSKGRFCVRFLEMLGTVGIPLARSSPEAKSAAR